MPLIKSVIRTKYNVKVTVWTEIIKLVCKLKESFTKIIVFQFSLVQENCDCMLPWEYFASFQ